MMKIGSLLAGNLKKSQTPTIHEPNTNHTWTRHQPYMNQTPTIHEPNTKHTWTRHQPYMNHTPNIHEPCTSKIFLAFTLVTSFLTSRCTLWRYVTIPSRNVTTYNVPTTDLKVSYYFRFSRALRARFLTNQKSLFYQYMIINLSKQMINKTF